ncbi:TerD family protein [Bacillus cereus group sp. TH204-1LC]|uniref:TerD family protein n=1 Tax=Bacillus cereus group TaxID=86661 RepID=UPI000BF684E2|nr:MULTISPECIES: TerD family protein [Bacillus cereus group]MDA1616269.1 TerD family protein [Bacillus cereus group sp. TH204-1LC]PFB64402.1 tellurium resistance protein TerD [Bacillus cereus]PGT10254.1 tellurium resistance protein TerD [Bacillus cereus]
MAVNLQKVVGGQRINLRKEQPGLKKLRAEISWDENRFDTGGKHDLDIFAVALQSNGKCREDRDFIVAFGYDDNGNNLAIHPSGAIVHSGDEMSGSKEGADEVISVDFTRIPAHITEMHFIASTNDGVRFGDVRNAKVVLVNDETNEPMYEYDLEENYSTETAILLFKLYLKDGDWRFGAEGKGYNKGVEAFIVEYGLQVG